MAHETFQCTHCRQKRPVREAQLWVKTVKTTKDQVVAEPLKKCKHCAESEKLAAQRKQLASHLEEDDQTMYDNLASFPSLAHWRKALDDKVVNGIFQVQCMLRLPNQPILSRQMAEMITESFSNATSCRWK